MYLLSNFSFVNDYLVVRASRDIIKGEEVSNCYGIVKFSNVFYLNYSLYNTLIIRTTLYDNDTRRETT